MINKKYLESLIEKQENGIIEKHIIWEYVTRHSLNITHSPILKNYLGAFSVDYITSEFFNDTFLANVELLENLLELTIPKHDRKINGAFFTPSYIVDFIIKELQPTEKDKCLDPSCGSGAFLIGLVKYYKNKYNKSIKNTIIENIFGADILPYNIQKTKIILSIYALEHNEILEDKDFNLYLQDSLQANWNNEFEIIVGNPPYVKYQDLSDENRVYLLRNWESIDNGTFNLYFAFFELGYNILTKNALYTTKKR